MKAEFAVAKGKRELSVRGAGTGGFGKLVRLIAASVTVPFLVAPISKAQNLNWEGQTGAFVTPFAYTSASPGNGFGHPAGSFHYLDGGEVIGGLYQVSATEGFLKRFEAGYTHSFESAGNTAGLSPLFYGGFNIFHGKANLLPENAWKHNFLPAISVGFVVRSQVAHITSNDKTNGDAYVVATKTITQIKGLPIVVNGGIKGTNASVLGIAGNSPSWQGRGFGAVGFVLPGPKSKLVVGSEVLQEPHFIQGVPGATLPTTLTYFVRVLPSTERPFNIDFGVAQAAGNIAPGTDIKARAQFAFGISYKF
jgi:hypothetical protein